MMERAFNFNAGPSALPLPVLEKARDELLAYKETGISILETSHRSPAFSDLMTEIDERFRKLLSLPADYQVLFLGGGANLQFYMVPLNLLQPGKTGNYVNTGAWSGKAIKEARKVGEVAIAASSEDAKFSRIPEASEINLTPDAAYLHITTNNTIAGTQWQCLPNTQGVPLVADMSSDILSRPIDLTNMGLIYAGAQKNLGPAGVTVAIIRKDLIGHAPPGTAAMLDYAIHAEKASLYNTPPAYGIYMVNLVLEWLLKSGGLTAMAERNAAKAKQLYDAIDNSDGFYRGAVQTDSRSLMNVTFRLGSEEQEKAFLQAAAKAGLVGLKGHRSVGGIRASIYNAVPPEAVAALVSLMEDFKASS